VVTAAGVPTAGRVVVVRLAGMVMVVVMVSAAASSGGSDRGPDQGRPGGGLEGVCRGHGGRPRYLVHDAAGRFATAPDDRVR